MSLIDRVALWMGYSPAYRSRNNLRAYAAASMGRLTADWLSTATTIDHDIRSGMVPVRARARDLSQNNEYAKAFLRACKKNIVGSEGFALQVKSMNYETDGNGKTKLVPDSLANSIIENAFYRWGRKETATVTGKMSFRKVQEVCVETAARDGEIFIRIFRGQNVNRYGFSLQLIEPDWVDEKYNTELKNGNIIRMGIEQDEWRRPVAYYLSRRNNTLDLYGTIIPAGPYVRIPAREMIHLYDPERADQSRGMSWMAPAMLGLHDLKGYVEAAIINARSGASKQGFFRDPNGTGDEYHGDTVDATGRQIATSEPGTFQDIGQLEFQAYDPKYPDQQFDGFMKSILRGISSGLGVSFSSISNDLTEVNFSSIRAGLIEERETWKTIQSWFIETFLDRVYSEWLNMALLTGSVNLPSVKYDKFNNPKWTGRRWSWVDPLKDVEASKAERAAGFKSATMIANEAGRDYEDILQEIASERELEKQYGITPDYGGKSDGKDDQSADGGAQDVQPRQGNGQGKGKDGRSRLFV